MTSPRDAFITAMRQVAATVTVVTTDGPAGQSGATVSAFTSLSADPPSVLVCLKADSRIAKAVRDNGVFCVNILPVRQLQHLRKEGVRYVASPLDWHSCCRVC